MKGNRLLVQERIEFMKHLKEQGFGCLQGTRFETRQNERSVAQESKYYTEEALWDMCKGNLQRSAALPTALGVDSMMQLITHSTD